MSFKNLIDKCVVRIVAEYIETKWDIPYLKEPPGHGQGTGFFIDNKGHILTCAHVIDSAKHVYIEIPNETSEKYVCEIIGICPSFDIGLLRCTKYLPKKYLQLGDSNKLKIEDKVQVVGYPVSLKRNKSNSNNLKFTVGIIGGQQDGFIQTDSAINPGNSGGPLFSKGKVVGINSMKLVGRSIESVGYSIPINNFKIIKDDLLGIKSDAENKIVHRPDLLFEYNNTTKELLKEITNNKISDGIIISKIYKQSILYNISNLNVGDIITNINGIDIDNFGYSKNFKWLDTSIKINVILNHFKNNEKIHITYFNMKSKNIKKISVNLKPCIMPIRTLYPQFEKINYYVFGGMIFIDLCKNYIVQNTISFSGNSGNNSINSNLLYIYNNKEELLKPKLCLTTILNKQIGIIKNISNGDIIVKVNDINVDDVNSLKKALTHPIIINKNKYIKIENENGHFVIMNIKDLLNEDKNFHSNYRYNISDIYNKII